MSEFWRDTMRHPRGKSVDNFFGPVHSSTYVYDRVPQLGWDRYALGVRDAREIPAFSSWGGGDISFQPLDHQFGPYANYSNTRRGIERSKSFSQGLKFKNLTNEYQPLPRPQKLEYERIRMLSRSNSHLPSPPRRTLPRPPRKELSRSNSHLPTSFTKMIPRSGTDNTSSSEDYYHISTNQFNSDFMSNNEKAKNNKTSNSEKSLLNKFQTDVNSNYLKVSRSNSRLTSTLKKFLPKRKTSNNSEPNVGVYSNHKYIIRINENEEPSQKIWTNSSDNVSQVTVNQGVARKASFMNSKKVQRSNSVMPFMQKKMNRSLIDLSEKKQDDTDQGVEEASSLPKEDYPWELSNVNNNSMRRPVQDDLVNSEQSPEPEEEVSPKFSPSSPVAAKVSRRAIITKNTKDTSKVEFTTEDQWFSKEKLYKDHIAEVFEKWANIEDEIWAKVIILERNRRVAKAYARAPVLTLNGSEDGFDGFKIGVNGFDNPMRDHKVKEFKAQIGAGCKLKMGDNGDILVKRIGKGNIYIKNILEETAVSNEILKLPNGLLELDRALKLFDMKKFKQNMNRELKRQYPDRNKIETQCISTLAFVKNEVEVLDSPIWIMIINIVALEMLGDKMPKLGGDNPRKDNRLIKGITGGSSDEDPYSLTASGSSRSSGKVLPDKNGDFSVDSDTYQPRNWAYQQSQNDLEDDYISSTQARFPRSSSRPRQRSGTEDVPDDPYYSGYSARVPAYIGDQDKKERASRRDTARFNTAYRGSTSGIVDSSLDPTWLHMKKFQTANGAGDHYKALCRK